MYINFKVLSVFLSAFLLGCTGNSGGSKTDVNSDLKRFSGVVNNSSVIRIGVDAIPIGKHGQFSKNQQNNVTSLANSSDENGKFGFSIEERDVGPYVLTVTAPEFDAGTEFDKAAKMSCQLVPKCVVDGKDVNFGEYYSVEPKRQWSAAVESVSNGQFIVINPITEMARALGYTTYINDGTNISGDLESDLAEANKPAANYYSNHGILKGNTQTASLVGLSDVLSIEPANLSLLHTLNTSSSSNIKASIRYGALLAAWQQLELEHNNSLLAGDPTFQQMVIKEYLANQGQLYQSLDSDPDKFTLKKWYQAARQNLVEVRTYYNGLGRSIPAEVGSVIRDFEDEISGFKEGVTTDARPSINQQYEDDYSDAVAKTKAMVNYLSTLHANFATEEFRTSVKSSSDLITSETRALSPSFDKIFQILMLINEYYLSCTHSGCVDPDYLTETFVDQDDIDKQAAIKAWWNKSSISKTYDSANKTLNIVDSSKSDLKLVISQAKVFDANNPEGSEKTNIHDLLIKGAFEYKSLRLELSDYAIEGDASSSDDIESSLRFSFPEALAQLPETPKEIAGGRGITENENLVPDYIELVLPNFKLYDSLKVESSEKLEISGSLSALLIATTDAGDDLLDEGDKNRYGKRFNLSNVKATLRLNGEAQGTIVNADGVEVSINDNALFFIEASASESFVSSQDYYAYFPDQKYPTFEDFFKPREGFDVGAESPFDLVKSRRGTMNFPKLNTKGEASEGETVEVDYLELDYEIGGAERYVVYGNIDGADKYWGLICSIQPENEDLLDAAGGDYIVGVFDEDGNPILDGDGNEIKKSLLTCPFRDEYTGTASPDDLIKQVYKLNKNLVNLREVSGHGAYRINYPLSGEDLADFPAAEGSFSGTLEEPIVLGVDSLRFQFKPNLVNPDKTGYLPDSIVDVSLVWRTHEVVDVNAFLAFDTERVINNPNGSGLPYLAVGSDSESYSVAYRTDAEGNESGEYVMAWRGVRFVDGAPGEMVMERTDVEDEKEGVFAGIGSNISYGGKADFSDKKCGFFGRTNDELIDAGKCDAIAYFTFRGLVTGSLREEREGVYVIRYIDGSFQILGG